MTQFDFIDEFQEKMEKRLKMGNSDYGDGLFNGHDLINDIEEELLDLANYAYLMYARLKVLEKKLPMYVKGTVKDD